MAGDSPTLVHEVRALLEQGRYDDAGRKALAGLQAEPDDAVLMGLLAFALEADGHVRDALGWAQRSLSLDPQQAWVLAVRARALLAGAGPAPDAVQSAYAAVQLEPGDEAYRYTLTRAYLASGNVTDAKAAAASIRALAPASSLGPLAEALVELDGMRFLRVHPVWAVLVTIATGGVALLVYALVWAVFRLRRHGRQRRADALLAEALQRNPGNAHARALSAPRVRRRC